MKEIGIKLQEARNAKKLSLEALNERTKINVSILRDIEAGQAENLPETYYRAFVRTIAKEVGLDPDVLIREYDSRRKVSKVQQDDQKASVAGAWNLSEAWMRWRKTALVVAACLVLAVLIVLIVRFGSRPTSERALSDLPGQQVESDDRHPVMGADSTSGAFFIEAVGLVDVWIEVGIDSSANEAIFLSKGEKRAWHADDSVFVGLDDPRGIRLSLGGRPLEWAADPISGVNLSIDRYGIIRHTPRLKESVAEPEAEPNAEPDTEPEMEPEADVPQVLLGTIAQKDLMEQYPMFAQNRDAYRPDMAAISRIDSLRPSLSIVCFMGTWDSLSQDIVPKVLRVIQLCSFSRISVSLMGVDSNLQDRAGMVDFHRIQGIPTVLFLSRGYEIGRMVGRPDQPVEYRFLDIVEKSESLLKDEEETSQDTLRENGGDGERFYRFR